MSTPNWREDQMRRRWRKDEDAKLIQLVTIYRETNWETVGVLIEHTIYAGILYIHADIRTLGKSGNSCNLRWNNYLKPGLDHTKIADEEFITILRLHKQHGSLWGTIAQKLSEDRPDNLKRTGSIIKNFWNGPVKKRSAELNLDMDSHLFHETMINILTSTFAGQPSDPRGQGFDYTLDDVRPFNLKDIDEALDYLYQNNQQFYG